MVFFPLFATGFVLDDYLNDNEFFGGDIVVISSASSKTSFSLAFLLNEDRQRKVVGLTAAANQAFVEGMGIYDEVVTYDDIVTRRRQEGCFHRHGWQRQGNGKHSSSLWRQLCLQRGRRNHSLGG